MGFDELSIQEQEGELAAQRAWFVSLPERHQVQSRPGDFLAGWLSASKWIKARVVAEGERS